MIPTINYKILEAVILLSLSPGNGRPAADLSAGESTAGKTTTLQEVVVTAGESEGITSASRIGRNAMSHLQPTSFTDLLELLPGNMSQTPDMTGVNSISLRETGNITATGGKSDNPDFAISSLGTLFMIDGAPVNTEANMSGVPSYSAGDPEAKRDIANRGVDMRAISTDNIESVEIVRGIPSAEYGNLTSGLVNIRRTRRPGPFTARFKADEFSKLLSLSKGFGIGNTLINIDGGWLDSKADPRDNLENYRRLNFSARVNHDFYRPCLTTSLTVGADYTGSFDNAKQDPDLSYGKIDDFKSSYNRMALTAMLRMEPTSSRWLREVTLNASASYQIDRTERHKQVAPQRASVAPTSMAEGVQEGSYLLSEYVADYFSESRPLSTCVKLTADGVLHGTTLSHAYKAGAEWTVAKNFGKGQIYDLTRPLSASWTTRPRDYRDIPALHILSFFAEEKATLTFGANIAEFQAGLRLSMLPGLDSRYYLSGRVHADPRINAVWNFPTFTASGKAVRLLLAAGYGLTTRFPTIDYLHPQVSYNDFIELNYYDSSKPAERSRIILRTYINDPANHALRAARNMKWEVRGGGSWGKTTFSVTYFRERMRSGFRYTTEYHPYEYTLYDASAIDPSSLSGKPQTTGLPYETRRVLAGTGKVTNGSRLDKEGIEFQLTTPRWSLLKTALTVSGAWFHTVYSSSEQVFVPVSDVVGNSAVRDRFVGLYNSDNGRVNNRFNTNFMFDTQIPRWGLLFTTSLQCLWFESTRRMKESGIPSHYISAEDGKLHQFRAEDLNDPLLRHLVRNFNDDAFRRQTIPPALYVNLKATKKIGRWLRISAFVNNIIDYLPDFHSNGLLIRRSVDTYFGAEINITI